jgi:hypothetical protein
MRRPVIGYREWVLIGDELISPLARTAWTADPVRAECLPGCRTARNLWREPTAHDGPAPDPGCVCGIYAMCTPGQLRGHDRFTVVRGAVALWGRIELHQRGMRAEYARIVALALPRARSSEPVVRQAADRLGIPAVPAKSLEQVATAYGAPVAPELIPA